MYNQALNVSRSNTLWQKAHLRKNDTVLKLQMSILPFQTQHFKNHLHFLTLEQAMHSAHRVYLFISCDSHQIQCLFPHPALTAVLFNGDAPYMYLL